MATTTAGRHPSMPEEALEVRVVRVDPEDRAARVDREAIQSEPCSCMEFRRSVRARVFLRSSPRRLIWLGESSLLIGSLNKRR